ncbi:hypothetical protein [Caldisalinibacter kiritimatiensis]|uniref:DUF5132 domain-containing protein n=1 Tax=Caldisalinibacter kiritimatiensis TaxID=1304284 RepID=R1CS54_9FIRM|nr:hypothetical protein [Caldisalinibacter kiritimatiensis]EOC99518.1 hypothetical protein L21TH_2430 [Caldisalinibacter kiritimatiensis]
MEPLGIVYGVLTFYGIKGLKKPMRKAAVFTTSQLFKALDKTKETAYNVKEGFEDIIAEAHYENMKRNKSIMSDYFEEGGEE